jgi:transcriptional regulator with XRE-family HTH domain
MEFKDRLRTARKEKGLTQEQLAELVHVTQGAIQSLESGRVKSATFLWRIALILGVNPEWLEEGREPKALAESSLRNETRILEQKLSILSVPLLKIDNVKNWLENAKLPEGCRSIQMPITDLNISKKSFFIKIEGDAMISIAEPSKSLFPDELALIEPSLCPDSGSIVLAEINNKDLKIRQYMKDGNEELLKAHNNSYPLIRMDDDIKILGVVVLTQKIRINHSK